MKQFILIFLFAFFSNIGITKAQVQVDYFGWDTAYSYYPTDIIKTNDGGFMITGSRYFCCFSIENISTRQFFYKTNSGGDTLWTKEIYHQSGPSRFFLMQTPALDYLSIGITQDSFLCGQFGFSNPISDIFVRKFSPQGSQIMDSAYSMDCHDYIEDAIVKSPVEMTFLMHPTDFGNGSAHYIQKSDAAGTITTLPISLNYWPTQIVELPGGYLVGSHNGITKFDPNGAALWTQNPSFMPYPMVELLPISGDSLLAVISTRTRGVESTEFVKMDTNLNISWRKQYAFPTYDIMDHSSGNYLILGTLNQEIGVWAISPRGDSVWSKSYPTTPETFPQKFIENGVGKYAILGGLSERATGARHGRTILIQDSVSFNSPLAIENRVLPQVDIFPNPAKDGFFVDFKQPQQGKLFTAECYNMLGEKIRSTQPFSGKTWIETSAWPSGIYSILVREGKNLVIQKKILIE